MTRKKSYVVTLALCPFFEQLGHHEETSTAVKRPGSLPVPFLVPKTTQDQKAKSTKE